jgi:signal transduction histidine kinase/CheY-like chemotaxis protein
MKPAQIISVLIALLLLASLWLRSMSGGTYVMDSALSTLDQFVIADSDLHRDVLSARAGVLHNYDPLVAEVRALYDCIDRLRTAVAHDRELSAAVEQLERTVQEEERLTEEFKTDNALLQNSLAHFQMLSTRLLDEGGNEELGRQTSELATALLRYTMDTSESATSILDGRLARIPAAADRRDARAHDLGVLVAHAQILRRLLPQTNATLKALFAIPSNHQQAALRVIWSARRTAAKNLSILFRYAVYGISLILLVWLVYLGFRLQSRALSLRRRVEIERIIAGISTQFINSRSHEIAAHIHSALSELGTQLGADRAYFVAAGNSTHTYKWCRPDRTFPRGWPEASPSVAAGFEVSPHGIIEVVDASRVTADHTHYPLRGAGLRGWLCIVGTAERLGRAVLGFDAVDKGSQLAWRESGLLRMAFDAIANALGREALERERERLQENLQSARRMEMVGAFASGIAHNFNNIVGAIQGYAETAQAHVGPGSRAAENIMEIRRAGDRARDLVQQILKFGRRGEVRKARICVYSLMDETKSLLDASFAGHVAVIVRRRAVSAFVLGDMTQLQQVILNVCNNAAQAMECPGSIEIEVSTREVEKPVHTGHGKLTPGSYTVIAVSDSGHGMDAMTLERIFEPFFSTRAGGNGLGLATAREIVLQHSGAVSVTSAPGRGTQFDIWLPCAPPHAAPEPQSPQPPGRGSGETVLVLEADQDRLLRHEEILAALGYEPIGFTDCSQAVAACKVTPARFDAALLCCYLHMSRSVISHVAALRASVPRLPVIIATSSAHEIGAPALEGAGVAQIIRHPFTSTELADALADCLLPR